VLTANLEQTYPYYAIIFYSVAYGEPDPLFWLYDRQITPTFAQGFDNFNLQLAIDTGPVGMQCDFNGDGVVNTEDINPFILALTDAAGFAAAFADVDLLVADPNQDGLINTEDINSFIQCLTGGPALALIIPEPTSLVLLGMGVLALARRRR
jgi:hypothetical protein